MKTLLCVIIVLILALGIVELQAATRHQEPARVTNERGEDEAREEDEGDGPRNEVALVIAGTREREESATSLTIGAEYERRLSERVGIVGELEYVRGPGSWVYAMPLIIRPAGGFKLFFGPGLERRAVHAEQESSEPSAGNAHENLFLRRMGTGYTWEFSER